MWQRELLCWKVEVILVKLTSEKMLLLRKEQFTSFNIDLYCKRTHFIYSFFLLSDDWLDSTAFKTSIFLKHEEVCSSSISGAQAPVHKTLHRKVEFLLQTKL